MRILHVLGKLDRGGVETWLVQLLRQVDRSRYRMDFLVHTTAAGAYDDEVTALGARIIPCLHPDRPLAYARNFRTVLKTFGPYDCVHSHVHHYSGYVLLLARLLGVPIRIAHSHTGKLESKASRPRKTYLFLMRMLLAQNATAAIAVSELAGNSLTNSWKSKRCWHLLPYGIDMGKFSDGNSQTNLRHLLGIRSAVPVVGHVGRFVDVKNHGKFVEIAKELFRIDPNIHFLLVGDGPLRPQVEAEIAVAGLKDHFTLTGNRADVPEILQHAIDVFLFPSQYEGLPIALMEAQLAGLPCVASDVITPEAALGPGMVSWLPLTASAADWANTVHQAVTRAERHSVSPEVRERLSIESCCRNLTQLYDRLASNQVPQSTHSAKAVRSA
jgi:glycosyltransferase involved in cell wall biosynthesis